MFGLDGKTAIVTGGGSGIGRAISHTFASAGALVSVLELNETAGREVVAEIQDAGWSAEFFRCDVSHAKQVQGAVEMVFARHGQVDILVNNAGVAHIGTAETTTEEDFDRIFQVNVKGAFLCTRAVLPLMKDAGVGVIINLASVASLVGIRDRFAYSMSKGAMMTMTYSVAKDYLEYGIRCNGIAPARVHTPFVDGFLRDNYPGHEKEMFERLSATQPIGRMGKPEEIAALALYLASDEASFITGTIVPVDGGFITLNN